MKMTEATKHLSAFDELMALLDKLEQAQKTAYKELVAATKAQKEAQNAWHDATFGIEAGIVEEVDAKKAKKALEEANERLEMAKARYEAANRANALENVKQNAKVQALIAKATEEADVELTKLEQTWDEELQVIEKIKEQYLEAVKRFADISDAAKEIINQLQRVNQIIPNSIPRHLFSAHRYVPLAPWELTIERETINKYLRSKQSR
jgi:putative cell wall-binding protein